MGSSVEVSHFEPVGTDHDPLRIELAGSEDASRFMLGTQVEIVFLLRELVRTRALVTVRTDTADTSLLSTLLAVDEAAGTLVFDAGSDDRTNRRLQESPRLAFLTTLERVRVLFAGCGARLILHDHRPAFAMPIPSEVMRLQRREYFRLTASVVTPIDCIVPLPAQASGGHAVARLHDIGLGGVCLIGEPAGVSLDPGATHRNCRIELPGIGTMVTTLEVCHSFRVTGLDRHTVRRTGCRFVRPSHAALALLNRFILKTEVARKHAR